MESPVWGRTGCSWMQQPRLHVWRTRLDMRRAERPAPLRVSLYCDVFPPGSSLPEKAQSPSSMGPDASRITTRSPGSRALMPPASPRAAPVLGP